MLACVARGMGSVLSLQEVDPNVLVDDPPLMAEIESMFSRTKQIVDEKVLSWVGLGSVGLGWGRLWVGIVIVLSWVGV